MRMDLTAMDEWLAERCGMYTEWLDEGRIAYSSLVNPIGKSLPDRQWVLPRTAANASAAAASAPARSSRGLYTTSPNAATVAACASALARLKRSS